LATNVIGVPSWSTNAVLVDNSNPAVLAYRDVEINGSTNINLCNGTVRFWFKPDWDSGSGPQSEAPLLELGAKGSTNGAWGLFLDPQGATISFCTQTNSLDTLTTNLTAPISWTSNQWHQIVLTYSATNSTLYLDGQVVVTSGLGVACYPGPTVRAQGFTIGSDAAGNNQASGAFDELETFNYPLDISSALDADGDGVVDYVQDIYSNGQGNSGQTNWLGILQVIITQPRNNSIIP